MEKSLTNITFKAGTEVVIAGIQEACECFHCGRMLKYGVRLESDENAGLFGADCISKSIKEKSYMGRKYKVSAEAIRELAWVASRGATFAARRGYVLGGPQFRLELKSDLKNV
jgi:hypothetical protein